MAELQRSPKSYEGITLAPQTQARILKQMSQFLDWCVGEGELTANPWEALKVKDRPEVHPHGVLTDDQVAILLSQGQGAAQCPALRAPHRHALRGDLWAHGRGHHSQGQPGALCQHQAQRCRLLKSKAAEREVPLHGILEQLLDTRSANSGRLFPTSRGSGGEALCLPQALTLSSMAPCSTPPASGSSPSVSAQGSLSTSPQPSWASLARSANKLTYGLYSAGISDAQKREIVEGVRVPER